MTTTVVPSVPWRIRELGMLPGFRLRVTFMDGTAGHVEMAAFLARPDTAGTVFEPLRDPAFFSQARIVLGAVTWPNGADLAPDAMHDEIRAKGVWTLD